MQSPRRVDCRADIDKTRFVVEPPRDPEPRRSRLECRDGARQGRQGAFRQSAVSLQWKLPVCLPKKRMFDTAEVAGPGFLNIRLKPDVFIAVLREVLALGADFRPRTGRPGRRVADKVNVEYVSANPTGPMHVGHGRGAVFGDALANLLLSRATRSRANITSTTPARRSMYSRAPHICATARRSAKILATSRRVFIPAII